MTNRNWLWGILGKRSRRKQPAKRQNNRALQIEPLECRQLLSVAPAAYTGPSDPDLAAFLAVQTPNPHPTGDPPTSTAQMIPLSAYALPPDAPDPFPQLAIGLQQIDCSIENNPQARPSFWGETTAAGRDVYKLHLCDNGMLIDSWTINWGDGSDPQTVTNKNAFSISQPPTNTPWITHQYAGDPSQYAITVSAYSFDGTYTGGTGNPGALDQSFNVIPGNAMDSSHGGQQPDWAIQNGNVGQQTTNFESNAGFDSAAAVTLDNGNILAVGTTASGQFGLARYVVDPGQTDDGNPDPNFGTDGQVTTTFSLGSATADAVAIDAADGKIVVAGVVVDGNGYKELALACYNDADGSLDTTFGTSGLVTTYLGHHWNGTGAVAVESDGSILVAGGRNSSFALLHYFSDGARDTDFGVVQGCSGIATAMTLDANGDILVAGPSAQAYVGNQFAVMRFTPDGTPDETFGDDGTVSTMLSGYNSPPTAIAIQPSDGKILVAGQTTNSDGTTTDFALVRYNTDGSLDTSFGSGGIVKTSFGDGADGATGVAVQGDGRIVVSGISELDGNGDNTGEDHFALARYNPDGSLDTTFGPLGNGTVTTDFSALGFQSEDSVGMILDANGRVVVAGTALSSDSSYSSFAIACYDPGTASLVVHLEYDPPVLRMVVPDQVVGAGQTLNLPTLGMFACQSGLSPYDYTINWGDGSSTSPAEATIIFSGSGSTLSVGSFGGSHPYAVPGVYDVAATVTCSNGSQATQTIQVTVTSSPPAILTPAIPNATVNVGETYTLPTIAFTGSDTVSATINWGDGTTDSGDLAEPSFDNTQLAPVPGSLTDSHVYCPSSDTTYPVTISLTDGSGATASETFNVNVLAANVALTGFTTNGSSLQVSYTIGNETSAPFQIGIYSSPDGTTPDQLLSSYMVGGVNSSELIANSSNTVPITPPAADVPGDYYLIAVANSGLTQADNAIVFGGESFPGRRWHRLCFRPRHNILCHRRAGVCLLDCV